MSIDNHPSIVETPPVRGQRLVQWHDEEDTARLAQALAAQPPLRNAFIALHGDLGAGKTTFVRHLLRALGVTGRIKSPTYAVVEPHQGEGDQAIFHFDFYRFSDPREWEDAGFRDIFAGAGLKLAEWPANARGQLPVPDLSITIDAMSDDTRQVTLQAHSDSGLALLQAAA
ncbi:tRNA (adenosine(37)-N6)-threonylcarbamoyltransferase complex ATPase subunit type 1 TsaE [Xenophilus arseniciresistens]|uniref:tRNA (adenosine(37)-N6)-threonylcarbamoyltransferase complex ATPase subunit type 1 TsaE n=1 Tax=Xenophilus arseniciresistens TaxID=1283306 RepID=UPI0038CD11DE